MLLTNLFAIGMVASTAVAAPLAETADEISPPAAFELDADDTVSPEVANYTLEARDMPRYCYIDNKIEKTLPYTWDPQSQMCNDAGWGNQCCGTFVWGGSGNCPSWKDNEQDVRDLQLALHDQISKEGRWTQSKVGKWTCSFFILTTSAIPNRGVEMGFFRMILNAQAKPYDSGRLSSVNFNIGNDLITCKHWC